MLLMRSPIYKSARVNPELDSQGDEGCGKCGDGQHRILGRSLLHRSVGDGSRFDFDRGGSDALRWRRFLNADSGLRKIFLRAGRRGWKFRGFFFGFWL